MSRVFKDDSKKEFHCRECGKFLDSKELEEDGCNCETDDFIFANELLEEEE